MPRLLPLLVVVSLAVAALLAPPLAGAQEPTVPGVAAEDRPSDDPDDDPPADPTPREQSPGEQSPLEEPPADQPPVDQPPAPPAEPSSAEPDPPPPEGESGLPATREGFLPRLDVFIPEGDLDLRVSRLANKVLFEGQVKYNFIDGDITAFLRYRYYGYQRTYQVTAFDAVEFDGVEERSDEFERVRGFLLLTQWPHDYHHRTYLLAEVDRITSNKEVLRFDTNKTNTFLRAGYQIGTPNDPRSNAIVGERRAQVDQLFTAARDIGPGDFGLTSALTYGFDFTGGDFDYVKVEFEGLKRFELPRRLFVVGRLHGGTFLDKENRVLPAIEEPEEADGFTIPRSELFRLDGRENLIGVSERVRGTEQLYTTWELFYPWFTNQERRFLRLDWQNWYWILYGGYGMTGFDRDLFTDLDQWVPDLGIGFESSFRLKKYTFFLSGVIAQALEGEGDVEAKLSIKSYR
ncbi:MAG TPA: hypothetical protein VHQ65_01110 [Thermoanaerobaculia bacterium]|nr:hypothetical protein [Thermoanaerobaculia bacterium]